MDQLAFAVASKVSCKRVGEWMRGFAVVAVNGALA